MRQARNHATHFKCQERHLQQQPKPDLRDRRFSWYPWQSSTAIHLTPHVPGARSNEQLAQTEQAFLSQHRKDFWLSCMGVEKMWWWWVGHSGMCIALKWRRIHILCLFCPFMLSCNVTQRNPQTHTHTQNDLITTPVTEKSWFPNADEWIL